MLPRSCFPDNRNAKNCLKLPFILYITYFEDIISIRNNSVPVLIIRNMNKKQRDGVTVSSVLDKRTPNKDGKYPVKIKVYFQKIPKYYSTGICLTAEEWERLENGKSRDCREIKAEIEKSFSFVKQNVDELIENLCDENGYGKFVVLEMKERFDSLENDDKMKIIDTLSATTKANQKWAEGKKKQMNSDR